MIIDRYLYALKSSEAEWRIKLESTLNYIGYCSTESDPGVWFKWYINPSGEDYYK